MARPLRLEYAGALYHVTARGNRQSDIYESDDDRRGFLSILGEVCNSFNWLCHAFCLMDNHYHLLIETPDANLSKGMRQLNGVYTQNFNRAHGRVGHAFQGRYKAIHVEKESYLLALPRYIVLNPVRARMVRSANQCPWSSYRSTVGQAPKPDWLTTDWILSAFGKRRGQAMKQYSQFVSEGKKQPSPWERLSNQVFLGEEAFISNLQKMLDDKETISEIPSSQRRPPPLSLDTYEAQASSRNEAIVLAYRSGGYTQKEIGAHFDLHYGQVSKIISKAKCKT